MEKKHYIIYQTTNLINGKIYIGQHQTYNPNDEYLGSGKDLLKDIEIIGRKNFKRETLFDFDSFEEMNQKEREIVNEEFVSREDTYNVRVGGQQNNFTDIRNMGTKRAAELNWSNENYRKEKGKKISEALKRIWATDPDRFYNCKLHLNPYHFKGKHHTEETKQKIREKNRISLKGEKNGNYNTVWIHNNELKLKKQIKKHLLDEYLNNGWRMGAVEPKKIDESNPAHIRCWVNNGKESKFILKTDLSDYERWGWKLGRIYWIKYINERENGKKV